MSVYLIDGYNLLHHVLGHEAAGDLEEERTRLVDRIASYMGGTSDRAIVVFDAHSQVLQKTESATRNVEVYFGSFSRTADSIIEKEAYDLSQGDNVVVVSSDYALQQTILRPNVVRRSSRQFAGDLQEHTKRIAREIPGAQLAIQRDVSHFAMLQNPDQFNRTIIDFLSS